MFSDFAKHTRQSAEETKTNLAKKYLAVHCSLAPMPLVYAHVADDYALLELRTHQPNIHHYSQFGSFDTQTFVKIMRDGYAHLKGPIDVENRPSLSYFMDTLFPKPVGAEEWQAWHDDQDNWKKRALFMALNCNEKAGFYELVKGVMREQPFSPPPRRGGGEKGPKQGASERAPPPLRGVGDCNTGGDTGKDQIDDMCTRLHKIKLSGNMPPTSPQELASIINDLDMSSVDCSMKEKDKEEKQEKSEAKEVESAILPIVQRKLVFTNADAAAASAAAPTLNISDYRKRACLPATMPPLRIAKQFMLAAMQLQGNEHPQFEQLKTAEQTHFASFDKTKDVAALEECIDALDKQKLTQLLNVHADEPAFLAVAGKANEMDSAELVKAVIRQNKPCNALINVILGL